MKTLGVARCLAAVAAASLMLTACGSAGNGSGSDGSAAGKKRTIGVSFDLLNAIRQAEKASIQRAADAAGYSVIFNVADQDVQKQASQIQDLIQTKKVDAVIVIAQDGQQIAASASLAKAHNVPFLAIDRAVADQQNVTFQITGDPVEDGKAVAAEFIAAAGTTPLRVLELVGGLTDQNAIGRRDGFNAAVAGQPNITVVSQVPTDWNPAQALDGTSNALQKDPTINAIYVPSDFLLPSVQSALTAAGRLAPIGDPKHVFMVTIDGDQNGCKAIQARTLDADIATPVEEFGKQAVAAVTTAVSGQPVAPKSVQAKGLTLNQANYATTSSQVWGCAA
ncbi:sugar ABC transporter substrate-binding protein [Dactylosporangium sp. AC04546]|uniref:sugar ABC transporter substrate-binding protein n=1 Tax=Dactylosporangium sp. AC04546 TaxID=2862460 RepID=UPI001EDD6230|nr:sugar ABC transporter substrate-binding protein [Dactylosporangium sp. AC04546]WVK79020.1 sugar ABC transporter substrate-binding protein [Dactylosporangium sp. AC04546]